MRAWQRKRPSASLRSAPIQKLTTNLITNNPFSLVTKNLSMIRKTIKLRPLESGKPTPNPSRRAKTAYGKNAFFIPVAQAPAGT